MKRRNIAHQDATRKMGLLRKLSKRREQQREEWRRRAVDAAIEADKLRLELLQRDAWAKAWKREAKEMRASRDFWRWSDDMRVKEWAAREHAIGAWEQRALDAEAARDELLYWLKIAEVHLEWGDCTLENTHRQIQEIVAKVEFVVELAP